MLIALFACGSPEPSPAGSVPSVSPLPPVTDVETGRCETWTGTSPCTATEPVEQTDTALPPIAPPPFTVTDVTVAAGVDYFHWAKDPKTQRECAWTLLFGAGAAATDYDGDGDVDLFASRYQDPSLLFRNRGDGTFDEVGAAAGLVTSGWANGALWFDVDGDADLDLYVTRLREGEGNQLFVNDGLAGFSEQAAAWNLDLPPPADECSRQFSASAGDYDRDGDLDLHVSQWNNLDPSGDTSRTVLLRNDGATFTDVSASAGVYVEALAAFNSGFTDFDRDGWPDLWVVADFGQSRLFLNNADGTFRDETVAWGVGLDSNGMGGATGDWDGDGTIDWLVTSIAPGDPLDCSRPDWGCSGNVLYANGGSQFSWNTAALVGDGAWAWGAALTDVDRDGDLDLFHTAGEIDGAGWPYGPDQPRLFLNTLGVGADVAAAVGMVGTGFGRAALAFDADGDGDPELFQTENGGHPVLWRNDAPAADWLRVAARGPANRFGIGARVELERVPGGPVLVREIHANSGYLGNGPPEADFGLGVGGGSIHQVRVVWPDGAVTAVDQVAVGQVLVVEAP